MFSIRRSMMVLFAASMLGGIGCGGDDNGDGNSDARYLTIVGDVDVFAEGGQVRTLTVRYSNSSGDAIAGIVGFRIEGSPLGSVLSRYSGVTDGEGLVDIDLYVGTDGETAFQVIAEADLARPAAWRVAIALAPIEVEGKYRVESQFSLPEGLPGADALNSFIDLTDDPQDPATWILDQLEDQLSEPFKTIVSAARTGLGLDQELNELLLGNSDLVSDLINLGDDLGQIIRTLGLTSNLDVTRAQIETDSYLAKHRITGALFWVDGARYEMTTEDMGLATQGMVAVAIDAAVRNKRELLIGRHELELPYGEMLVFAINEIIAPNIDPFADDLTDVMVNLIDCESIGQAIADAVDFGSASLYEGACAAGVAAIVDDMLDDLRAIRADLVISGDAELIDGNRDRVAEKLHDGEWEGLLIFDSGEVILPRPDQKFVGYRIAGPEL